MSTFLLGKPMAMFKFSKKYGHMGHVLYLLRSIHLEVWCKIKFYCKWLKVTNRNETLFQDQFRSLLTPLPWHCWGLFLLSLVHYCYFQFRTGDESPHQHIYMVYIYYICVPFTYCVLLLWRHYCPATAFTIDRHYTMQSCNYDQMKYFPNYCNC